MLFQNLIFLNDFCWDIIIEINFLKMGLVHLIEGKSISLKKVISEEWMIQNYLNIYKLLEAHNFN